MAMENGYQQTGRRPDPALSSLAVWEGSGSAIRHLQTPMSGNHADMCMSLFKQLPYLLYRGRG